MNDLLRLTMLVALSRFVVGCCGGRCDDQMTLEIHLAAGRTALEGGTLTICQSGACSSGTPLWQDMPMSGWQEATIVLGGALSAAKVTLVVTPDDRTTIEAEVWPKGNPLSTTTTSDSSTPRGRRCSISPETRGRNGETPAANRARTERSGSGRPRRTASPAPREPANRARRSTPP